MIRFNLRNIIAKYNRKHFLHKLTITELSRRSGISRHSLSKLCGKYQQSKGVTFDTLNRLINFFGLPVSQFITYTPDGMTITLQNASDNKAISPLMNDKHLFFCKMVRKTVFIVVELHNRPINDSLLAFPQYIANKHSFKLVFREFDKHAFPNFGQVFKNNLTNQTKSYIYARILAHSGMLNANLVMNHADKLLMLPLLNFHDVWGIKIGLPKHYLLHNSLIVNNKSDGSKVIDQTSNHFKSDHPTNK